MSVRIHNRQQRVRISSGRLRRLTEGALSAVKRSDRDIDVTVVDDGEIRRLNYRYLGKRQATDVLAFNLEGPGPSRLLGEVIISAQTAARQASRLRVPVAIELDLLVVHGVLHLVGYDDDQPEAARRMHERERQILSRSRHRPLPGRLWIGLLRAGAGTRAVAASAVHPGTARPPFRLRSESRAARVRAR